MRLSLTVATLMLALPAQAQQIAIAHRGASAYAPEHTFFAYDLAMSQDTDMLECDVFLTRDEVPVCIHDETVDRTTGGSSSGAVSGYSLAELRAMDFGSWFNTANPTQARDEYVGAGIVPFEEQLDCYLRHNPQMRFHVETKDSADGRAEQVLADLLRRKGLLATGDVDGGKVRSSTIVMQSFDAASLARIKSLAPSLPTAFLFTTPNVTTLPWLLAGSGPDYIDAFAPNAALLLIDRLAVQRFHAQGHDVHTWTVNDETQMGTLLDMGVDGIFSNNPDRLRAAIDARGSGSTSEERGNPASFEPGCAGIAGRVTSNAGPGDVWRATGTRGVERVVDSEEEPSTPPPEAGPDAGSGGGAFSWWLLSLFALAGLRRRR